MNALLLGVLLSASPTTLAALELEAQQVPAAVAKLVGTHLVVKLTQKGFQVLSAADLSAMIGVERQKQLLGCNEETNCLAEIGAALNAKGVVLGSVGRLGQTRLLNVKVIASGTAQALVVCSGKADSDEGLLVEAERCADTIAAALRPTPVDAKPIAEAPASGVSEAPAQTPRRSWALAPIIVGGLGAALGVLMIVVANINATLTDSLDPVAARNATRTAEPVGTWGGVILGAGIAVAAAGTVLFLLPPAPVRPVAMLSPQGGFLGVSGVFP